MKEEILRVLGMIKEDKLEIKKGAELIEAMYANEHKEISPKKYDERMLKVLVESVKGDHVRINLPVQVIISIIKVTGKLPIKNEYMNGIDFEGLAETILSAIDHELLGEIVTVDSSDGDVVRVVVE